MKYTAILTPLLLTSTSITAQKSPAATSTSTSRTPLQFASPLQSFTIFDKESSSSLSSPRSKFLPRLKAGLLGERRAREVVHNELLRGNSITNSQSSLSETGWAEHSAQEEERKKKAIDAKIERGYDEAIKIYDRVVEKKRLASSSATATGANNNNKRYQIVGVVNHSKNKNKKEEITWYARSKPSNSNWNIRLIHVNRDAILRDLFVNGKIDLFGGYRNQLGVIGGGGDGAEDANEGRRMPKVMGEYAVKERSWRTLWNFSPIRFFTTPSGSYHRERRITPGIYTDGSSVYETVYRYRDGKNGMKPIGSLEKYLEQGKVDIEEIQKRLVEGVPDVVVEK